jgi:hypothetical protein
MVKNKWSYTPTAPILLHGVGMTIACVGNRTLTVLVINYIANYCVGVCISFFILLLLNMLGAVHRQL